MSTLVAFALGVAATLLVLWIALLLILFVKRPAGMRVAEVAALLPDMVRFLLAWMASPIDLVPDFIPVIGLVDDVVLAYLVLRSVARAAGPGVVSRHWPGSPEGLDAVRRLLQLEK